METVGLARLYVLFFVEVDAVFGAAGLQVLKIPPRAPQANAYAERWVRTVRNECLDWILIRNCGHLYRVLSVWVPGTRPHR